MMPKKKSDHVETVRLELQEKERDALELLSTTIAARNATQSVSNVANGVNSIVSPFLNMSVTSGIYFGGLIALLIGKLTNDLDEKGKTSPLASLLINQFGPVTLYDFATDPQAAALGRIQILKDLGSGFKSWVTENI